MKTINASWADDSLYTWVFWLFVFYIALYDYTFVNDELKKNSGITSTNLAMLASLLLSNRLQDISQVYSILLLAMQIFLFAPFMRKTIKKSNTKAY